MAVKMLQNNLLLIAALLICSLASAAASCGYTALSADFNRYSSRSYSTWNRGGAEDEFPRGLRYGSLYHM